MPNHWTRSELDLHLRLSAGRGKRAGLEQALRDAVRDGRLSSGAPLPSSRALARDLGIARGTVTQAYEQLVAEGYLTSRPRSGVRVAPQPTPPQAEDTAPPVPASLPPVRGADLRPGLPDLSAFPRRPWLAATRHVLQTAPNTAFGYGDPTGCLELRQALAEYLGRSRGVVATPDRVIVCAGYSHAIRLISRTLRRRGATAVAFEDPSEPWFPLLAEECGLTVGYAPVDRDGLVVDALTDEAAVTVTPAHQYPLGMTLGPARRTRLLTWARRHESFVVEDDYDGEFRYDRQPVGALQQLAPDRVIYAGTASKTMAPGLRIAWIVLPADLVAPLRDTIRAEEGHVSVIDQLVLAHLIRTGELDRHLRRCRSRYRRRRDRLQEAVAGHLPHARLTGIAAGLHAVLELPGDPAQEPRLLGHLAANEVAVDGLSSFHHRRDDHPLGIVIGYGSPPDHAYGNALDTLIDALRHHRAPGRT
ncbi:transcriptional regulator, GntR family [Thermomonospora echinospora]|uniref:Transcriptional regulator, GntR family n=1 Tax=Thermomonospora echinospora TaxID=1992 RepID=A0A1H6DA88_9ACTN|nr:PLP-dependent aminotransferase family protein [Thermomonospora echinospora]SEG81605.1 transcriptional regulator, GntR family [Thermomonospora echinospora]